MTYQDLIARKSQSAAASGFLVSESDLAPHLFPHQRDLTRWALRRGRAALFADTGLGKGPMLLEYAKHVSKIGRVLILAPLAVGPQLEREGVKFGVNAKYLRLDDPGQRIVISNYEMRHRFDPDQFCGLVIDESSILKSQDGKTRNELISDWAACPYRLACTATPAPNDFTELGNHAEFLGIKTRAEMLAEFFVHDGGSTQDWRVKGHAVTPFWRWVATWGAVVKMPSDLGHDDAGFALPPLRMHEHSIPVDDHNMAASGTLFPMPAVGLLEQRRARRSTIERRVAMAAKLTNGSDQAIVWCELNDEQDAVADLLGEECVSIDGKTHDDLKVERCERWLAGRVKVLVSKPAMFGFGLNFQNCHRVIFIGASHSYERTYQAIRRCWRFGQTSPVDVHIVASELEGNVIDSYRRKEADAAKMAQEMTAHVGAAVYCEVQGLSREFNEYQPKQGMELPQWLK